MASLKRLTQEERDFAASNHDLIYSYLRHKGLTVDEYYDVVVFGFLTAVNRFHTQLHLRKYQFSTIAYKCMGSSYRDYLIRQNRQKRSGCTISLDAPIGLDYAATLGDITPDCSNDDTKAVSSQMLEDIEKYLNRSQRRFLRLRLIGYTSKEISQMTHVKENTVYVNFVLMRNRIPARCVL